MTDKEIIQALRCTSTPGGPQEDCTGCTYYRKEQLDAELKEKLGVDTWPSCDVNKVGMDAADLIERLTAENVILPDGQASAIESLRKEIEWKDMVIALAQKEQAKAEAERDAIIEQIKERHDCLDCKHNDFCEFDGADDAIVFDCMNCMKEECPCNECCDSSRWEWRGLPEAPEEGEKA